MNCPLCLKELSDWRGCKCGWHSMVTCQGKTSILVMGDSPGTERWVMIPEGTLIVFDEGMD